MTAAPVSPGIVVGLYAEERLLRRAWRGTSLPPIRCAGASGARAAELARSLVASGARGLVSLGLAGGLDPNLASGALLLGECVVLPDGGRVGTDPAWRERLAARLRPALCPVTVPLAGRDNAVASREEKAGLRESSGAAAVDMESHGVARLAAEFGVPLLVVRAVADPAGQTIPAAALAGLRPDGNVSGAAVMAALARRPAQVAELLRLARQSAAALAILGRAVRLAGPDLGFV